MSEFVDIQEVYDETMTLYGINPSGKTTVELPCELVGKIVTLLDRQLQYEKHPNRLPLTTPYDSSSSDFDRGLLWEANFIAYYSWQSGELTPFVQGNVLLRQKDIVKACEDTRKLIEKLGLDSIVITSCKQHIEERKNEDEYHAD